MNLVHMSISGTVFILIVLLLRAIAVNKLPGRTFTALWTVAALRLILPVWLPVFTLRLPTAGQTALPTAAENFQSNRTGAMLVCVMWCVGAAVMAVFFVAGWLRCRKKFGKSLTENAEFAQCWLKDNRTKRKITIRRLDGLDTPLTYGIFRPVILLPDGMQGESQSRQRQVLLHEYIHIRRWDAVKKGMAAAALCLHWYNPAVWVMYFMFNRDLELACDQDVLSRLEGDNRREYAASLIEMEQKRSGFSPCGSYFCKNSIEERIVSIMKFKKKSLAAIVIAALIVSTLTLGAFAVGTYADRPTGNVWLYTLTPDTQNGLANPFSNGFVKVKVFSMSDFTSCAVASVEPGEYPLVAYFGEGQPIDAGTVKVRFQPTGEVKEVPVMTGTFTYTLAD